MPFVDLKITPTVDTEKTPAANEAGVVTSSFIRWRDGMPEKRGGWAKFISTAFNGVINALHTWKDVNTNVYLAVGATNQLVAVNSGKAVDISARYFGFAHPVSITTVLGSTEVTVNAPNSNLTIFDSVVFETHVSVGGIVLYGAYNVTTALGPDQFKITVPVAPTANVTNGGATATYTATNGSAIVTVTLNDHGYIAGEYYPAIVSCYFGGLTIDGPYVIQTASTNTFTIIAQNTARSANITNVSGNGATVTVTFEEPYQFNVGDTVVISGVNPVAYNGTKTVTAAPTSNTFQFAAATTTAYVSGGTVFNQVSKWNNGKMDLWYYTTRQPPVLGTGFGIGPYGTATNYVVTGASGTGATATVTFTGSYVFPVGSTVYVSSISPSAYNGSYTVTASSAGSVSYASTATSAYVSSGSVAIGVSSYGRGIENPPGASGSNISADDYWLDNWGEILVSCPKGGPIFAWSPSSGLKNSTLIANAPLANSGMCVVMPQQQIMAWGSTYNGISDPLQIRYSDAGDYTVWTPKSTNQAGGYNIPTGSQIQRIINVSQQVLVFTDVDIYAGQYVGPPFIWGFSKLATGCGLVGPKAVTTQAGAVFWMSQKQFFVKSGDGVIPLACSVWDAVFQNINPDYADKVVAASNSQFNEVTWFYPSAASDVNDSYVTYNTVSHSWDLGALSRSAWMDQSVLGSPIGGGPGGYLYQHEISTDADGDPISASFTTGYFVISNAEEMVFVDRVLPDMRWQTYSEYLESQKWTGGYPEQNGAAVQFTFTVLDNLGDVGRVHGPFTVNARSVFIPARFRGRYVQIKVSSEDLGSFWRLGRVRLRAAPDGRR